MSALAPPMPSMKNALGQPDNYNSASTGTGTSEEEASSAFHAEFDRVLRNNNGNNQGNDASSGSGSVSVSGSASASGSGSGGSESMLSLGGNKTHESAQTFGNTLVLRTMHHDMSMSMGMGVGMGPPKGQVMTPNHRKVFQCKGDPVNVSANGEDLRLSKIIRRLSNESNPAVALELCAKLDQAVRTPINQGYMSCSFVWILENMLTLYKQCSPAVLDECSKTLGLIGYINRKSYPIYEEFIVVNYRSCRRMQRYLIVALRTTLSCDTKGELHVYADKIMLLLKDFLENAESADNFTAVSNTLVQFSASYREAFECHFTDVVDIIIGWQLEAGQPVQLRAHCAQVLEQLTPYFSKQIEFSYGLLAQFVEDITGLEEEDPAERVAERMGALVGAFNTLLKCLARMQIFVGMPTCECIVQLAVDHLTKIMVPPMHSDAHVNINELLCICLLNNFGGLDPSTLEHLLLAQIDQLACLSVTHRQSVLYLLLCTVRRLRARLPPSLVHLIFHQSSSYLAEVRRQTPGGIEYRLLLRTCQETLLIRNVPLLQQAYKHLVDDIDACMLQLLSTSPPMDGIQKERQEEQEEEAERRAGEAGVLLVFHLAALAALAKQTSSIIGMYACKPSILELLLTNCRADELTLWSRYPAAHQAILGLLVVHCQANHNFRTNSSLLRDQELAAENTSPTANSFASILRFLDSVLQQAGQLATHNLRLLLQWTQQLLSECREKADLLLEQEHFVGICRHMAAAASKWTPQESAACIQTVLAYGPERLGHLPDLLILYRDTALQQLQVLSPNGHAPYAQIYAQLPLHLTLTGAESLTAGMASRRVCVWQQRMSQCSAVRDTVFRDFFERLQRPEQESLAHSVRELFVRSCQVASQDERQEKLSQCTKRCQRLATAWLQFEAARYCVDQRLRTTLGKPQETFLGFEAIIMRHARLLSGCAKELERSALDGLSLEQFVSMQGNLGLLLGFLDALEKLIYNAAEGSAFALRPPEKPVAAFFRLNNPTCQSWFNRIRIGVVIIAMHVQQPELVIRYAQQILLTQKTQDATYSQAIVYMAWAWVSCQEADSLRGLCLWARSRSSKSYQWLCCAADQAAGKLESALAGYRSILAEEEERQQQKQQPELEPHTRQFVVAQMMQCLQDLGQWSQLVELKQQQLTRPEDRELNPFLQRSNVEVSALERLLAKGEESYASSMDDFSGALQQLSLWPSDWDGSGSGSGSGGGCGSSGGRGSFSSVHVSQRTEDMVLQKLMEDRCLPDQARNLLDVQWRDSLLNPSCDQRSWRELTLLRHIVQGVSGGQELCLLPLNPAERCQSRSNPINSAILMRCLAWTQLLRQHCAPGSWETLCLDAAAAAREEGNLQLAESMLAQFFGQPLEEIAAQFAAQEQGVPTESPELLRGYSELVKCLHVQQSQCGDLSSSVDVCAALCLNIQRSSHHPEVGADLLLNLSDWIAARTCNGLATGQSPALLQLLDQLPECPLTCGPRASQPLAIPQAERLVARLIHASLQQRPHCEAVIAYGNWCYRWGKKIVDSGCVLTQADVTALGQVLDTAQPLDNDQLGELLQALSMEQPPANCAEVCPEATRARDDEAARNCLRRLTLLADKSPDVLDAVLQIWRRAIANTYDYYKDAARSYFQYLSLKSGSVSVSLSGSESGSREKTAEGGGGKERYHVDDSNLVTTTLRLLRLIVKHASGLQEVLEQGLQTTPIAPWKVIIPQLFSRLNHHEPYVRKSVCDLLCRLAESRPQLVIFPAVVGANREEQQQQQQQQQLDAAVAPSTEDACCYGYLLGELSKQAPEAVQHVQLMVKELRRVCLLWDEYWIHSLAHIYNTYVSRVSALATEFRADDHEGKNNRFNVWRPQLLADLEHLAALTARPAETSYERSFRKRFDGPIRSTLDALRTRRYPEAWDKLKQLYHILQSNMIRGTGSTLKMQSLSPVLCGIGRMRISMPGLDAHGQDADQVYIESVEGSVCVLPTKTKPKKVAFYGSNGQRYTFLFKGMEDLHLDERIMQFLSISNAIMACRSDAPGNGCYRAHHYSVIPLGPQSGLISWVDGVTPLFALYKKWQQRQPPQVTGKSGAGGAVVNANATRRFTDLFYSKLSPLLAKHNLLVSDPRRQWPISALRQVLAELSQETPGDLLARELWCQAGNAAEWRQSVRRYARCMSVMSMIGYVIGLGDRHLDNVLINLGSGDIVHIDYNVCFEKGRTLRIPEKVPFRLTQNLVHAMGITGIEGSFRLGCEYVLKVMRKERETLLTLLEAFVYDPLVDWTINDDAQALRRSLNAKQGAGGAAGGPGCGELKCHKKDKNKTKIHDWDAKRQHFLSKLGVLQKYWATNKTDMMLQLQEMNHEMGNLQAAQTKQLAAEQELVELNQRSALVSEIKSLGTAMESHSFNTASLRHAVRRGHSEALAALSAERLADFNQVQCLLGTYGQCLQPYHLTELHSQLVQWQMEAENDGECMESTALAEALPLAGYAGMRGQLEELMGRLVVVALQSTEHLQQYAAVMNFFPEQSHRQNLFVRFHDSFGAYIQQSGGAMDSSGSNAHSPSGSIICTADVLGVADALESAWMRLSCQLHDATQRYAAKQAQALNLGAPPTSALLAMIGQSGCSLLLLQASLVRTLDRAGGAFAAYEQVALASQDEELLQHQLHFIHLVRSMCQGVLALAEQEDLHLGQMESLLAALSHLKQMFEYDLPASIYRLLLLQPNLGQLSALCHLSASSLGQLYLEATLEKEHQPAEEFPAECRFLLSLQPAYEQFQLAASSLASLVRSVKMMLEDAHDSQVQQLMELGLLKSGHVELDDECFFGLVSEALESSRSCDVHEMARPVLGLVQRLQAESLAGLLPLLARNFYTAVGPQCQPTATCGVLGDAAQADHLCEGLFISLQSDGGLQQQQAEMALLNQQLELHTLAASAQHWAYSEALGAQLRCGHHIVSRPKLAAIVGEVWQELDQSLASLQHLEAGLGSLVEQLQPQRSSWKRSHIESLLRMEQARSHRVAGLVAVVRQLADAASAVSRLEQHAGALGEEGLVQVDHLEQWLAAHGQWQASSSRISAVEQAVVELLDPEGAIDPYWLENVHGLLEEHTCKVQREIAALEGEQQSKHRFICTLLKETLRLQDNMPRFHVRSLCSDAQAQAQGQGQGKLVPTDVQLLGGHLRDCQRLLHALFQRLQDLRKDLCAERRGGSLQPATLQSWRQQLQLILLTASQEVNEFFKSMDDFLQHAAETDSYETFTHSKGASNLHEQKRNAYGVSVWKKIRMKLEGRDPDANQRSSVAEQVDYAIREATNPDNLAVLYEGWTPWV
ncbi:serine/threonine-protein kinase Smg1 [Drosophila elegans]|uniref:serine/threonine-protein kinase Smg1 n=1 Tax=Drosophila elegans TaxID=30023 RepID=UPI0007E8619C|nr:serine/threonine-protein kinase Smg1 [Drosophila elegans]